MLILDPKLADNFVECIWAYRLIATAVLTIAVIRIEVGRRLDDDPMLKAMMGHLHRQLAAGLDVQQRAMQPWRLAGDGCPRGNWVTSASLKFQSKFGFVS